MDSLESRPEQPTRHHGRNRGHRGEALDLTESRASGLATDWEAAQEPNEQQGHPLFLQSLGEPPASALYHGDVSSSPPALHQKTSASQEFFQVGRNG